MARTGLSVTLALIMAVLLIIMTTQIVFRYGFNTSLIWAEEVCRHLLIWASFLGVVLAYERGEVASVTMARDRLPRRLGIACAIVANLVMLGFIGFLVQFGLAYAERVGSQPIPALGFIFRDLDLETRAPSVYWVYVALPVGMALFAIRLLVDIGLYGALWRSGGHVADLRPVRLDHDGEAPA